MRPELIIPPPRIARAHRDLILAVGLVTLVTCAVLGIVSAFAWSVDNAAQRVAHDPVVQTEIVQAASQVMRLSGLSKGADGEILNYRADSDVLVIPEDSHDPQIGSILTPDGTSWLLHAGERVQFVYGVRLQRWLMILAPSP